MRKILILFFAIVTMLLVACSNGDSASVDAEELSCAAASPGSSSSEFWVVSSSETALEVSSSSTKSSSSELYISYGMMVDERDGQEYKTVAIGNLVWMAENLNYAYLQPTSTLDSSSWCYNNEPDSCAKYGRLYLWSAAVEACPEKWHLPSQSEMETLIIAMDYNASLMKSTSGWMDYSDGLDSYGITILPAGLLDTREINTSPIFKGIQEQAFLWSESPDESLPAYQSRKYVAAAIAMTLDNKHSGAYFSSVNVGYANSVRCVKDYDFALFE